MNQQRRKAFQQWWDTKGEWVEEPNQRRGGMSGVQRIPLDNKIIYVKRMTHHLFHSVCHPFGVPMVIRERARIKKFESLGVTVPKIVYCDAMKIEGVWHGLLATEEMPGYQCISDWYANEAPNASPETKQQLLEQVAHAFKKIHDAHYQHGSCSVRHIYVKTAEDVIDAGFLDLEKSRFRTLKQKAINSDFRYVGKTLGDIPQQDWQFVQDYYFSLK